jgi:phenylalanyl-tRNA synthetase beta chain
MPTIEIEYQDFVKLLGIRIEKNVEKLNEILTFVKGEVKAFDEKEEILTVEIKDTNRPDLWNVEGLTRALHGFLGLDRELKNYEIVDDSGVKVHVDKRLWMIRPYIACAVVRDLNLNDTIIRGLMRLQDKLDQTYGRNRRRTSIGLYNFDLLSPPLHYTVTKPTETSFVPLGFEQEMNLKEILEKHPKGVEYGDIVRRFEVYPILLDSEKRVLSFPPIINSNDLGKITPETKNVLVEVTGTTYETVLNTLNIVVFSLIDRGGKTYSTTIKYAYGGKNETVVTPRIEASTMLLRVEYVNQILGLKLTAKHIAELLGEARFNVKSRGKNSLLVYIPPYRFDIMHPIDLVEDVAIAYDYNNIQPLWRRLPTTGATNPQTEFYDYAREIMIGLGFQEILTYTLTNKQALFYKMKLKPEKTMEIANPKVLTLTCLRSWLLPSLMEFLSNNQHVEYPQKIFELGTVVIPDKEEETKTREEQRLAAVTTHANAGFTEIKSVLDALITSLNLQWQIREATHPTFIPGRTGKVEIGKTDVGVIGEIHPKVLEAWDLEKPAAAFEVDVSKIYRLTLQDTDK